MTVATLLGSGLSAEALAKRDTAVGSAVAGPKVHAASDADRQTENVCKRRGPLLHLDAKSLPEKLDRCDRRGDLLLAGAKQLDLADRVVAGWAVVHIDRAGTLYKSGQHARSQHASSQTAVLSNAHSAPLAYEKRHKV